MERPERGSPLQEAPPVIWGHMFTRETGVYVSQISVCVSSQGLEACRCLTGLRPGVELGSGLEVRPGDLWAGEAGRVRAAGLRGAAREAVCGSGQAGPSLGLGGRSVAPRLSCGPLDLHDGLSRLPPWEPQRLAVPCWGSALVPYFLGAGWGVRRGSTS